MLFLVVGFIYTHITVVRRCCCYDMYAVLLRLAFAVGLPLPVVSAVDRPGLDQGLSRLRDNTKVHFSARCFLDVPHLARPPHSAGGGLGRSRFVS